MVAGEEAWRALPVPLELAEQRAYFFEVDSFEINRGGDGGF